MRDAIYLFYFLFSSDLSFFDILREIDITKYDIINTFHVNLKNLNCIEKSYHSWWILYILVETQLLRRKMRDLWIAMKRLLEKNKYRSKGLFVQDPLLRQLLIVRLRQLLVWVWNWKKVGEQDIGTYIPAIFGYISYAIKKVRNSQLLIFEKNGLVWPAYIWPAHFFQILKVRKI